MKIRLSILTILMVSLLVTQTTAQSIRKPQGKEVVSYARLGGPNYVSFIVDPEYHIDSIFYRVNKGDIKIIYPLITGGRICNFVTEHNLSLKERIDTLEYWIYANGFKIFNYKLSLTTSFGVWSKLEPCGKDEKPNYPPIKELIKNNE